jgi:ribosomal protein L37E
LREAFADLGGFGVTSSWTCPVCQSRLSYENEARECENCGYRRKVRRRAEIGEFSEPEAEIENAWDGKDRIENARVGIDEGGDGA